MNEENKKFITSDLFSNRVFNILKHKGITIDELYEKINNEIGYSISKNNLSIYFQRVPSVNFLIALSKALNVSTDYLLGLEDFDYYNLGFDYNYNDRRYRKYIGNYNFYFFPTVSNSPNKLIKATLTISFDSTYKVELSIPTDENETKHYFGEFILSNNYKVGYITLQERELGELVYISFCDPVINGMTKASFILGAMLSISSGDFKRVPVMSRCLLTRELIDESDYSIIKSNLYLNSKYINIDSNCIYSSLNTIDLDDTKKEKMSERLMSAFEKKHYYCIEESYILNTLRNDFNLSLTESEQIISALRLQAINNANSKLNKIIDTRLFNYFKNNC